MTGKLSRHQDYKAMLQARDAGKLALPGFSHSVGGRTLRPARNGPWLPIGVFLVTKLGLELFAWLCGVCEQALGSRPGLADYRN